MEAYAGILKCTLSHVKAMILGAGQCTNGSVLWLHCNTHSDLPSTHTYPCPPI